MYRKDLFGPSKYPTMPHRGEKFNLSVFGPELWQEDETDYEYHEFEKDGSVNLFPKELCYVDVCNYDRKESRYRCMDSLPPMLSSSKRWHGVFMLDYPFEQTYTEELDFCSVNDVVEQIQLGLSKMYADVEHYGEPLHIPEVLRIERLSYDMKSGNIDISIGS